MKLCSAKRAAELLDVSVARIYEMARTHILPKHVAVRLGRQLRIDEDALREWIRSGGAALPGGWRRSVD